MTKKRGSQLWLSLPLGFHYFSAIIILSEIVAVIAKVDCRVFLSYQLFRRQNKQHCRANTTKFFLVLGKISLFFSCFFSRIACILVSEVSKKQVCGGKCSQ